MDHPERKNAFETTSGILLKAVYSGEDGREDYSGRVGDPGEFPYARGIRPRSYRERLWTMRQYAGFGSALEANRRFKYLIENGQTGLSVAFDLPTQMGMDSDHPLAEGEVGRVGVAVDTVADMEALFDGIPLDQVSTSMTINATASILLAMLQVVGERRGIPPDQLRGTVQNDILKEYIARGTYVYPPEPSLRLVTDLMEYCGRRMPRWNTISISGYHIREAGATAVQELAFTLGNGIAYVRNALSRGLRFDDFAPRLSFFFAVHNDFLEEIAKFRAARRIWAKIARDQFGAGDSRSMLLRVHAQTAGSTLTAQFPDANAVRVTLQCVATVLDGAQSIHTNSRDEALAIPHDDAVLLALRTQQIIAYESGIASTADPVGGSFAIESLTDELEERATEYLNRIDAMGGMPGAVECGFVQREIQDAAYAYQRSIERGERGVVGVNRYVSEAEVQKVPLHRVDGEAESRQVSRLRRARETRDGATVSEALRVLEHQAASGTNLMPAIVEAVRAEASIGEISDTLRGVFGEYRASVAV
jgi:methylmalonyl-CoA mutase N-terminal domain/subunit